MTLSVAVAGASGYAGGEILRLLSGHPEFVVRTVTAHRNIGQPVPIVHPHLRDYSHLAFVDTSHEQLTGHDVVFLAVPHGTSGEIAEHISPETLVVDCGADHRLERESDWIGYYGGQYHGVWEYGVPELPRTGKTQRSRLLHARRIAAPGCNASTVALSIAPGVRSGIIDATDIVATLAVGPSGAGRTLQSHLLAAEILGSASAYAVGGRHRHIPEVLQALRWAGADAPGLTFTPVLVPMARGILAVTTARLSPGYSAVDVRAAWTDAYVGERFVQVLSDGTFPRVSDVLGANTALMGVGVDERAGRVVVVAAVDNLTKGTAGAAIQSANLALGFAEATGLPTNGVAP